MVSLNSDWNNNYYDQYASKIGEHNRALAALIDGKFGSGQAQKIMYRLFLPDPLENDESGHTSKIIGSIPQPAHNFLLSYVFKYALDGPQNADIKDLEFFYGLVREQETSEISDQINDVNGTKRYKMINKPFTQKDLFETITNALSPLNIKFIPPTQNLSKPVQTLDYFETNGDFLIGPKDDEDSGFFDFGLEFVQT